MYMFNIDDSIQQLQHKKSMVASRDHLSVKPSQWLWNNQAELSTAKAKHRPNT